MQEIKQWLSNRQWQQGVALYEKYGSNRNLLRHFTNAGETPVLRQHLEWQLEQLAIEQGTIVVAPPVVIAQPTPQPKPQPTIQQPSPAVQDTPAEIQELFAARASRINDRAKLSNSLRNFPQDDNEGRRDVCQQIEALSETINNYADTIKYWQEHKTLPAATNEVAIEAFVMPDDSTAQLKLLHNLRSQRSKAKGKLGKLPNTHPDTIGIEKKIADLDRHIQELEKAITGT